MPRMMASNILFAVRHNSETVGTTTIDTINPLITCQIILEVRPLYFVTGC